MHGLYLSRKCGDIVQLSRELLGLHCWFHRNVAFSALIRGADIAGWKNALTKTWLYRGTLHGVVYEELPQLLALHAGECSFDWLLGEVQMKEIMDRVIALMEDGVYSRAEMRRIFAHDYDDEVIDRVFSSWGGIFVYLARLGKVAFRDMTSRDFDLIDAEPTQMADEVLPVLLRQFFAAYGPATLADAAWFFGLGSEDRQKLHVFNRVRKSADGAKFPARDSFGAGRAACRGFPLPRCAGGWRPSARFRRAHASGYGRDPCGTPRGCRCAPGSARRWESPAL